MHGESGGTGVFQMFSIHGRWDPRMESLHIEGTDEQLLSDRLESDINEGDGSLPASLTARDLATQISNAWKEAVCRESCLFPTSCHTMLPQSELTCDDPLSFLRPPFLLPLCLSYDVFQCFSNLC